MHHLAKITFGKFTQKPFHGECACGTAIDSGSNEEARNFLAMHLTRLQGINSAEFVDETVQPAPLPVPEEEKAEPEGEPLSSGEGIATTPTSPVPGASEKSPSNSASGTTDSSSAPSTDVKTEASTEPSNLDGQEKSATTGTS